jgi:hypothetical protein
MISLTGSCLKAGISFLKKVIEAYSELISYFIEASRNFI